MDYQTAGTDAYILVPTDADPSVCEVIDVGCVTSIDPGTDASDQIDTTCLRDRTRRFAAGLTTPGQGSIGINADPTNAAHLKLFELSKSKKTIKFAVGWSDGTAAPTAGAGSGVATVSVTAPGTGYTSAPTVAFSGGGGGTGATATAALSAGGCDFTLPTSRTWNTFEGYVSGFPFNFALNSVVQSEVSIQRSGDNFWYPKV